RLRADHDILARHRFDRLAEDPFGAIGGGSIEQINPELHGLSDYGDSIGLALSLSQPQLAEPATAEPGDADLQSPVAEGCVIHRFPAAFLPRFRRRVELSTMHSSAPLRRGLSGNTNLRNVVYSHFAARREITRT